MPYQKLSLLLMFNSVKATENNKLCLININQSGKTRDMENAIYAGNRLNLVEICDQTDT